MATIARAAATATTESHLLADVQLALGSFSKDLTAQLVAKVHAQLGAGQPSRKTVETAVVNSLPVLLEQTFITSFLANKKQAREHRAFLSHVLSAAELQATLGSGRSAHVNATAGDDIQASADADQWLTSEAASKVLHVSRTHLNTLADSGALGVVRRTQGGHRRVAKVALLKYKALIQERQSKGLDALVAASQKLGLYDAELEGLPVKTGR